MLIVANALSSPETYLTIFLVKTASFQCVHLFLEKSGF